MSFKRDRDDHGALGCLKRRRVEDLLGEDVPADEVSRLSNGRLTCLVCYHRPIFDTLSVLYVHRQGKRHLASAAYRDQKQQELSALVEKRAHEAFVKTGSAAALHAQPPTTLHQGLGLGAPYDPRVKKHKLKPYDRKSRLDLHGSQDITKTMLETRTQAPVATDTNSLPGNQMESGDQGYKNGRKIKTDITLGNNGHTHGKSAGNKDYEKKDLGQKKRETKHSYLNDSGPEITHKNMQKVLMGTDNVSKYYLARRQQSQQNNTGVGFGDNNSSTVNTSKEITLGLHNTWDKFKATKKTFSAVTVTSQTQIKHVEQTETQPDLPDADNTGSLEKEGMVTSENSAARPSLQEQDMQRAEKLRLLAGSGWKKDWDGRWIRDDDAEFDSDEEPPDIT